MDVKFCQDKPGQITDWVLGKQFIILHTYLTVFGVGKQRKAIEIEVVSKKNARKQTKCARNSGGKQTKASLECFCG